MDFKTISRYRDLQRQYTREVNKRWPLWVVIQKLEGDIRDLLLTYPELRDIAEEPNK